MLEVYSVIIRYLQRRFNPFFYKIMFPCLSNIISFRVKVSHVKRCRKEQRKLELHTEA